MKEMEGPTGLKTNLKQLSNDTGAPKVNATVEAFLKTIERRLIIKFNYSRDLKKTKLDSELSWLMRGLSSSSQVVIPGNKTNSFCLLPLNEYDDYMSRHLKTVATAIKNEKIQSIHKECVRLCTELSVMEKISQAEAGSLRQMIESRAIPSPKFRIKEHKDPKGGHYPT